ncbi:MAG: DEAD/DEAH box helicase [Lewinellaceae bacterium]|nr:DEAD/DEAH box helicase [Lewinellaceae bacterium]
MRVVFNLYPFSENLYLPTANIVQVDKGGELTHLIQKAAPATIGAYGIELTPVLQGLFEAIERLTPRALEAKFKAPKAKTAAPLAQLLAQAETRATVETYIHREIEQFLSEIVRHRLPLTLDAERRTLAKDVQLHPATDDLVPHLFFQKTDAGIEYRFQLGTETEKWSIREHDALPLTNTNPAWVVARYALFRVPGINGNMLRPFRNKDVIQIPPDKVRVYFRQFIAKNAGRTQIEAEGFAVQTADRLLAVRLEPTEHLLEKTWLLKPVFVYDGAEFRYGERRDRITTLDIPDDETREITVHLVCRDQSAEQGFVEKLQTFGMEAEHRMFRLPTSGALADILHWLTSQRAALERAGFTLVAPQVDGRMLALLPADIAVRSEAAGDWFDVRGQVQIGAHSFPFHVFVPHLRSGNPYFPLPDGTFFLIPDEWFARYGDLANSLREAGEQLRLPKSLFTLLQPATDSATADFQPVDPDQIDYHPPTDLQATLRPYQLHGVKWLVGHFQHGFGACLADDMGLGKTLQTIAALLYVKHNATPEKEQSILPDFAKNSTSENSHTSDQPASKNAALLAPGGGAQYSLFQSYQAEIRPLQALVILPASLVFNWQRELAQFAPGLFVYAHSGPRRLKDIRAIAGHDVVLTTYHTARQDLDLLGKLEWRVIVLDESQQIKNRESEVSRVVRALRGQFKISLSGTPIENSLADLWTQMEFINPDTLGTFREFREAFLVPIEKGKDAVARQRLFARIRPFFLRRTKMEVAPDLPALSEQVFYSEMNPAQHKQYEKTRSAVRNEILSLFDNPKTRIMALQALMRLRQLANHPALVEPDSDLGSGKFEDVLAQWDTVQRAGHKVLFFSSFEKHLQLFRREFERRRLPYAWLTGDTAMPDRAREIERFQGDPAVQAFFMTVKAGGVGLNLTAADYVFLLDPWWNPAVEDQAIARAHRIGQTRPVTALRFISRNTIEEKIRQLQEQKKQLGLDFFAAGSEAPMLTRAELEGLLG